MSRVSARAHFTPIKCRFRHRDRAQQIQKMLKYPKTRIPDWFVEREWPQLNGGGVVAQVQIDKLLGRWCGEYGRR
jgi:hypothetical protein